MGKFEMVESVNVDTESIVVKIPKIEVEDPCMSPFVKEGDETKLINNGGGGGGELYPITPSPNSETAEIRSSSDQTEELETISDCETPTGSIFNPFAPGDEELFALAPKKKVVRETRIPIRRQLNFDDCCDSDEEKVEVVVSDEDEEEANLFRALCESFLALIVSNQIVSNQVKDISVESVAEGVDGGVFNGGMKTPTGIPLLTGMAETCPDAPERPHFKSRRLNLNICRKLEFESCLI